MSVNFNSILGAIGGSAGGLNFPFTMSLTASIYGRSEQTPQGLINTSNLVFTVDKVNDAITVNPSARQTTEGYINGVNAYTYTLISAISFTPTESRAIDDGFYFIEKDNDLVPVDFGEYRKFIEGLEAEAEKNKQTNNQSETVKEQV